MMVCVSAYEIVPDGEIFPPVDCSSRTISNDPQGRGVRPSVAPTQRPENRRRRAGKHVFFLRGAIFFLMLLSAVRVDAGNDAYYFYRDYSYGSESLYNPISLLVNGGFDTFQMFDRQPTWQNMYWDRAATNVWRCIASPMPIINSFGWNRFVNQELFPTHLDVNESQYVPNYMLHLVGGGMEYRKITEWYSAHSFPAPAFCGMVTAMSFEYLNEVAENGPDYYPNEDCIPDLLIFQPLGILLFSINDVADFFSTTLSLNDWSNPVAVSFAPFAVRNAGQCFVLKLPLNKSHSVSAFSVFGSFGMVGLSLKMNEEDAVSFGGGLTSTGRVDLPPEHGVHSNTIVMGPMAGIYYDRNNSLLASVTYSAAANNMLRIHVFPGLLSSGVFSPGMFLSFSNVGAATMGIVMNVLPVGFSGFSPHL
jgi:hypothetical protein